ncbi:MAG: site-2 protease family protein [Anaerolineales bacterium]|nr:site-2 protease family protein [Anaerolineales bacterium]
MTDPYDLEALSRIVSRVMAVEETMLGGPKQNFIFRARGRLTQDSEQAYARLADSVKPLGLTALLRGDNARQEILLVKDLSRPGGGNARINLLLFLLTLGSVIFTAAINAVPASALPCETPADLAGSLAYQWKLIVILAGQALANLPAGLPFALSFLAVLGTHEFGHYLAGRKNNTRVTLPFFIPLPLISPFGTLGAVISMQEPPRNRNVLAEIGIAGPLAGFLVALPLLVIGLTMSTVEALPADLGPCEGFSLEGNSILYMLAKLAVFGRMLPSPAVFDTAPVLFYLRSFFTGFPFPMEGVDVIIHPLAFGAWAGLLITGLNLIPAGQLDGGHLLYVLLGERAGRILPWIMFGMVVLGLFWPGWFLWVVIIFFLGRAHAEPLDTVTPLDFRHRILAWVGLILFVLVFTPIPLQVFGG